MYRPTLQLSQSHRNAVSIFLAVLMSLVLMQLPASRREVIAESFQSTLLSTGQWLFSRIIRYSHSEAKVQYLLKENVRLALENMQLAEASEENKRLRLALQFPRRLEYDNLIPAEVIGHDPDNIYDTILLRAGTNSGVSKDQTVVTTDGLVGHVISVNEKISVVQLIMRSRVSSIVQRGRAHGMVSWAPSERFQLRYLDARSEIMLGDRVVTSGLGGRFPKGITVGYVTKIDEHSNHRLFQDVFLQSKVDFGDLEEVFVVGNSG